MCVALDKAVSFGEVKNNVMDQMSAGSHQCHTEVLILSVTAFEGGVSGRKRSQ